MSQIANTQTLVWAVVLCVACALGFLTGKASVLPLLVVGGVFFTMVSWSRPIILLVLMGSLIPLEGEGVVATVVIPWTMAKLVTAFALALWFVRRLVLRQSFSVLGEELYVAIFMVVMILLSLFVAQEVRSAIMSTASMVLVLVLALFVMQLGQDVELKRAMFWMSAAGIAYLIYGLTYSAYASGRAALDWSQGNPNDWALNLNFFCLPLIGLLVGERRFRWHMVLGLLLVLLFANHALAASRGAMIALVAALPVMGILLRKQTPIVSVGMVVATVGSLVFFDFSLILERFETVSDQLDYSSMSRKEAAWIGLALFKENWLLGTGLGTFRYAFADASHSGIIRTAHNMYINLMAETGIVGVIGGFAWLGFIARTAWVTIRRAWNTEYEGIAIGLMALLVSWGVGGLFADLFFDTVVYFYLGILLALSRRLNASQSLTAEQKALVSVGPS